MRLVTSFAPFEITASHRSKSVVRATVRARVTHCGGPICRPNFSGFVLAVISNGANDVTSLMYWYTGSVDF